MNHLPETPHGEATSRESIDRPAPWVLALGMEVASGGRPWLRTLAGAPLILCPMLLLRLIGAGDTGAAEQDPELVAVVEKVTAVVSVVSWVLAGAFLLGGTVYWVVCRYAYAVWRSLPEAEREELTRKRIEGLRQALVALGGVDPEGLPIRPEDLDELSDRHRRLLQELQEAAEKTTSPICAGARARTDDLVMASRLHRALSKDTIVRPPHTAAASTDPRVLALVELDDEIQAAAAAIGESLDAGRCNCDQESHGRLLRAGDRAHAVLHGLDPEMAAGTPRPRWIGRLIWAGVVISIAALPIGLLTSVPSVVVSAVGVSVTGVGFIAASWRTPADPDPISKLRRRLFVVAWIAVVAAAAAVLLT